MGQLSERIQDYRERLRDWWADGGLGRGLLAVALVVYLLIALVVGFFWSTEPEPFAVKERADQRAAAMGLENVIGFTTTSTLMEKKIEKHTRKKKNKEKVTKKKFTKR